jgi:glutamine synthetase
MNFQSPEKISEILQKNGTKIVACSFVDSAGVSRVKAVPINKLVSAARNGIGISYTFAVFGVNDHITTAPGFDTPSGDMRLVPDLSAAVPLVGAPGWIWAPVWQYDQEMNIMPVCQRHFTQRMVEMADAKGISFKMTYEVEFTLLDENDQPVGKGLPGYGIVKLLPVESFLIALTDALESQGINVSQLHPEYADGQYEISVDPRDPLTAADQFLLLRQTICRIAQQYGFRASFAPVVIPGEVGNGSHIHFSAWREGKNLFTGGSGPQELTAEGEHMAAGVLDRLPEMLSLLATSVLSYERLQPSNWAGAFTCWGWENREAALRLCKGTKTIRTKAANFELKCIDGTINPYLVVGILIAAAMEGLERKTALPEPIQVNPADLSEDEQRAKGIRQLSASLQEAIEQLEKSSFVRSALGDPLYECYLAVKKFDWESYSSMTLDDMVADLRWRYA